jgi:hypothetical protein
MREQWSGVSSRFVRRINGDRNTGCGLHHLKLEEAATSLLLPHQLFDRVFCLWSIEQMRGGVVDMVRQSSLVRQLLNPRRPAFKLARRKGAGNRCGFIGSHVSSFR